LREHLFICIILIIRLTSRLTFEPPLESWEELFLLIGRDGVDGGGIDAEAGGELEIFCKIERERKLVNSFKPPTSHNTYYTLQFSGFLFNKY